MAEIKDRIVSLRNEKNITQSQLAEELNISPSAIGMYEQGRRKPSYELLEEICDYFNVDMDYLMGRSDIKNRYQAGLKYDWEDKLKQKNRKQEESNIDMNTVINGDEFVMIPLYSSISAGYGSEEAEFIEMIAIPGLKNPQECFGVIVKGDSMEDKIDSGSIIIVRRDSMIENGQVGAFSYNEKSYVKQKKVYGNTVVLHSYNDKYKDLVVEEAEEFKEYGKVVMSITKF
ncbi:LexA family protein [Fusobacterium animalis]|uniref:LexA family protein n=1 Tax=Fusobacterium animalis TaxID=76859 RepID=UPI0034DE85BD